MMLNACTQTVTTKEQKIPVATHMGGSNTITEVCKELESAGASHLDVFQEWVADFADSAGNNAELGEVKGRHGKMYGWLGTES